MRTIFQQKQQIIDDHATHEKEKNEWMAGVGHNIGTPLTSIVLANEAISALDSQSSSPRDDMKLLVSQIRVATEHQVAGTTLMRGLRIDYETSARRRFPTREFVAQCEAITSAYGVRHPGVKFRTRFLRAPEFLASSAKLNSALSTISMLKSSPKRGLYVLP